MKKILWVFIIAIGVFLGVLAYDSFMGYLIQRTLQQALEQQQVSAQEARQKRLAYQESKRKAELYRNTACAINNDTNHCVCLHERTGARLALPQEECKKRAKEITR